MTQDTFNIILVGRPNVGKSSLFNALLGYRRSIVLDEPGTTRDILSETVPWTKEKCFLSDSQGLLDEQDEKELVRIVGEGDAFLLVVDATVGVSPFDKWIASALHRTRKPVLVCVNKIDVHDGFGEADFSGLGFEELLSVSASHRLNMQSLRDWCSRCVELEIPTETSSDLEVSEQSDAPKWDRPLATEEEPLCIAIVGRPNTGKSTLMNRLCRTQVSRVSAVALTTRDPVTFERKSKQGWIRLVDTAGIRRPRSEKKTIEEFSIGASIRSIREADVVFLMVASHEGITDQDMRLLNLIKREGKPVAVLLGFWDLARKVGQKRILDDSGFLRALSEFHVLPVSGATGFNTSRLFPLAYSMAVASRGRVKTSRLNRIVEGILRKNPPPTAGRQNFNILYASQVRVAPPTFVFFMNRKAALPGSYKKYLENQIRGELGLKGQPVRVLFRGERG